MAGPPVGLLPGRSERPTLSRYAGCGRPAVVLVVAHARLSRDSVLSAADARASGRVTVIKLLPPLQGRETLTWSMAAVAGL